MLKQSIHSDNLFLTHEWFDAWWQGFGGDNSLFILLLKDQNELVGIAPFMKFRRTFLGIPIKVISLMTNEHTTRADFIVKRNPVETIISLFKSLGEFQEDWDLIELNFVPAISTTVEAIIEQSVLFDFKYVLKPLNRTPYIPINGSWDAFYIGLKGHFKRNLKNREKRLNRLGEVKLERLTAGNGSLASCLQDVFEVGSNSWKELNNTAIGSTQQSRTFYMKLAENMLKKGWLNIFLLRFDNKPIAFQYSIKYRNRLLLLKTEYDLEFKPYSPGHLLLKSVLKECFSEHLQEFDFLGDSMLWKRDWTTLERTQIQALIFNNSYPSKILAQMEIRVKPFLKRVSHVRKISQPILTSR